MTIFHNLINRLREPTNDYFLLMAPFAYLVWEAVLYAVRGPNWIMIPQDLGYNYLLNALNVLNGDPIGSLIHPALTTIGFIAASTYLAHLFFGTGPLDTAVIADPEFYFSFSTYGAAVLTALCLYLMGYWGHHGLRSPRLALLLQSFIFLAPPTVMVMSSFASPESMLMMLSMLQVGLAVRTLDGRLENVAARAVYVFQTVVIGSVVVATKFIGLPLLVLPLLVIPGWRWRAYYCLGIGVGVLVSLSPIFLFDAHRAQFILDMNAISQSALAESQARGVGTGLTSFVEQVVPLFNDFPVFVYGMGLGLGLLLAVVFYRPMRQNAIRCCPWALRLFISAHATVIISFIFILSRPKGHYLAPFELIQGMGFTTFFIVAGHHFSSLPCIDIGRMKTMVLLGCVTLFGVVVSHNIFFKNGLELLTEIRSAAAQMQRFSYREPGNNAIVTAIPASNVPTALYHALQTSRNTQWESVAKTVPPNHYNYDYDGFNTYSAGRDVMSLSELLEAYDQVFFWAGKKIFGQHEWRRPIEAIWRDIRVARMERLSELVALAIHERFDVRLTREQNIARGWTLSNCGPDAVCLRFSADLIERKVVSHLRFLADPDQFMTMPVRWKLEGSSDGKNWQVIERFVDHRPWTALRDVDWPPLYKRAEELKQNRVYRLNNEKFYPFYRLVFPQNRAVAKSVPGQIIVYSTGGCAPEVRFLPTGTWFLRENDSTLPEIDVIPNGFWEETGAFPRILLNEGLPFFPRKYVLGTGNHGERGMDAWPRMPTSWSFEGSTNGKEWIVLDRKKNVPQWRPNEVRSFPVHSDQRFSHFRLVVESTEQPGVVRIYEFRIEGEGVVERRSAIRRELGKVNQQIGFERSGPFPLTLESEFSTPGLVSSYKLLVGPYGRDSTERMPKSWRLFGSLDGEAWRLIDTRTVDLSWRNGEERTFVPEVKSKFKYLRLEVRDVAAAERIVRLQEIKYFTPRTEPNKYDCSLQYQS